jgi:hypothetical protein
MTRIITEGSKSLLTRNGMRNSEWGASNASNYVRRTVNLPYAAFSCQRSADARSRDSAVPEALPLYRCDEVLLRKVLRERILYHLVRLFSSEHSSIRIQQLHSSTTEHLV